MAMPSASHQKNIFSWSVMKEEKTRGGQEHKNKRINFVSDWQKNSPS